MTHAATFALGVLAGLLVGLWLIARSVATPETASVPRDPYLERLARGRLMGGISTSQATGLRWN